MLRLRAWKSPKSNPKENRREPPAASPAVVERHRPACLGRAEERRKRHPISPTKASLTGKAFDFSLKDALKKGPVVVYFYPSAYTGGCNRQAHAFAVNKDKFDAAGATIIGVSQDSIARLNDFSADPEYCAGKFPVASDPDGKIAKSYGLKVTDRPSPVQGHARRRDRPCVHGAHDVRDCAGFQDRRHVLVRGRQDFARGPCHPVARRGHGTEERQGEVSNGGAMRDRAATLTAGSRIRWARAGRRAVRRPA